MDYNLTKTQRSIIIGKILGDGHLETANNKTFRLKIEHSIKQKEYVDWLYEQLKNLASNNPKIKKRERITSYWFNTSCSGTLRFYAQQFYKGNKKIIPKIINKILDPMALAIWFMDDGSLKSKNHKTYIIHSLGYTKKELEIMQEVLGKKFNIKTRLHRQYGKWRIYITSESRNVFRNLIEPYIVPSMRYKLG